MIESGLVGGLVFNLRAFETGVKDSAAYDTAIRKMLGENIIGEDLFAELAIADARQAADLLCFIYDQTECTDGWVALDVSPRMFDDPINLASAIKALYARVHRPNIMVNVPGTKEGLIAAVEVVSAGVPVNITHIFSTEQFYAAAEAYLKGVEQRLRAGLKPDISSVVSLNAGRWDAERLERGTDDVGKSLGFAIFQRTYERWQALFHSPRWERACLGGAQPLRFQCIGIEFDTPEIPKALTMNTRLAQLTVFTMSETPADQSVGAERCARPTLSDNNDSDRVTSRFFLSGEDIDSLAEMFQKDAVSLFVKEWFDLMTAIARKSAALTMIG